MKYTKLGFTNGQTLEDIHLNHIEDGIYQNSLEIERIDAEANTTAESINGLEDEISAIKAE